MGSGVLEDLSWITFFWILRHNERDARPMNRELSYQAYVERASLLDQASRWKSHQYAELTSRSKQMLHNTSRDSLLGSSRVIFGGLPAVNLHFVVLAEQTRSITSPQIHTINSSQSISTNNHVPLAILRSSPCSCRIVPGSGHNMLP